MQIGSVGLSIGSGRDPAGKEAIDVRYEPPEGLSPAEVGTLIDERVDMVDIWLCLLDFADDIMLANRDFDVLGPASWSLVSNVRRDVLVGTCSSPPEPLRLLKTLKNQ